jgi:hypothetical protein
MSDGSAGSDDGRPESRCVLPRSPSRPRVASMTTLCVCAAPCPRGHRSVDWLPFARASFVW